MEFFKFSLTDEQVRLLHQILEDEYSRACRVAYVKREILHKVNHFQGYLLALDSLIDEFNLQTDKYLEDNNRESFLPYDEPFKF